MRGCCPEAAAEQPNHHNSPAVNASTASMRTLKRVHVEDKGSTIHARKILTYVKHNTRTCYQIATLYTCSRTDTQVFLPSIIVRLDLHI